jgi:glucosyl-3-phosphoglycerate synthase
MPALDEVETIGEICKSIRAELIEECALVDELVVVDTGSTDGTIEHARAEGADVYRVDEIFPEIPVEPGGGKGEALWRSLAVSSGDIIVWIDSDVRNFSSTYIAELAAPLLEEESILMVKAFHHRPLGGDGDGKPPGGARVTEIVARPAINLLYPELAGVIQPLAGEYAVRRGPIEELPFSTGYGVEIGLLIDLVERFGLGALAQVDLGVRFHANQDNVALGRMSFQVLSAMLHRLHRSGRLRLIDDLPPEIAQFSERDGSPKITSSDLAVVERPPMEQVRARHR